MLSALLKGKRARAQSETRMAPPKTVFGDFATAHNSIVANSNSPLPPVPTRLHPPLPLAIRGPDGRFLSAALGSPAPEVPEKEIGTKFPSISTSGDSSGGFPGHYILPYSSGDGSVNCAGKSGEQPANEAASASPDINQVKVPVSALNVRKFGAHRRSASLGALKFKDAPQIFKSNFGHAGEAKSKEPTDADVNQAYLKPHAYNPEAQDVLHPVPNSTIGSIVDKYGNDDSKDWTHHAAWYQQTLDRPESGLGQFTWSPPASVLGSEKNEDDFSSSAWSPEDFVEEMIASGLPPQDRLPRGPPSGFGSHRFAAHRDESSKSYATKDQSHSSKSYENTRNLLELTYPTIPVTSFEVPPIAHHGSSKKASLSSSSSGGKSSRDRSDSQASSGLLSPSNNGLSSTGRNVSDQSVARISIISSDGSIMSRNLSHREVSTLERQVAKYLRRESLASSYDHRASDIFHEYEHTGHRASIEYSDDGEDSARGSSIMEAPTSGREARLGFRDDGSGTISRKGTPPLLFGRGTAAMKGVSFGPTHSTGSTSGKHVDGSLGEEDENDWETDVGSRGFNHYPTHGTMGKFTAGSSLADNSDSLSLSPPKPSELSSRGNAMMQHRAHPRYAHTFNLLKDKQSGEFVMMPEYKFGDGASFPDRNAVTNPVVTRIVNNPYQHPIPLSKEHAHPFASSPPPMSSARPKTRNNNLPSYIQSKDEASNKADRLRSYLHSDQRDVSSKSVGIYGSTHGFPSSAWVSTAGATVSDDTQLIPLHQNSFAKVTILGPKGNITGTPEGTGAREVGSSLANASSPGVNFSSSPMHFPSSPFRPFARTHDHSSSQVSGSAKSAKIAHRRTIDGSSESIKAQDTGEFFERIKNHPIQRNPYLDSDEEDFEDITPVDSRILPAEVDAHRQHLIDHALLPKNPSPPPDPRRHSAPLESIELRDFTPPKKQSPKKQSDKAGTTITKLTSYVPNFQGMREGMRTRLRSPNRPQPKDNNVSSELPLSSHGPGDNHFSHTNCGGTLGATSEVVMPALPSPIDSDNGENKEIKRALRIKAMRMNKLELDALDGSKASLRAWVEARAPTADYYPTRARGDLLIPNINRPIGLPPIYRPGHTIVRTESPHLYRIRHGLRTEAAILERQKVHSRMFLALFILFPPMWLIFGHGYLDGVMEWLTNGDCPCFRDEEKTAALYLGYGVAFLSIAGAVAGITIGLNQ